MKALGVNCVRVFLSYGSFYERPGVLSLDGLAKFDQFLALAEEAGIYVHPTGPDHWEGTPDWARGDRFAEEALLQAQEQFWSLFAARYRGRNVIFAYDLLNEPEVRWDTTAMRVKWNLWLERKYATTTALATAWRRSDPLPEFGAVPVPPPKDAPRDPALLDYQSFREVVATEWTRRQVAAIKDADPDALVTVGLIQWSVPAMIAAPFHYSAFRPVQQARLLDFLEIHFYPLAGGFFEYGSPAEGVRNLAYLEAVVREVALPGKPLVVAEFGWYGGGKLTLDQGKHRPATEADQAGWCGRLVELTAGLACGWLNWELYDHPQAGDVSQLTGLLTVDGQVKAWGNTFHALTKKYGQARWAQVPASARPILDWDLCVTSSQAGNDFRERYTEAFSLDRTKARAAE